jgi:hypothetical protein
MFKLCTSVSLMLIAAAAATACDGRLPTETPEEEPGQVMVANSGNKPNFFVSGPFVTFLDLCGYGRVRCELTSQQVVTTMSTDGAGGGHGQVNRLYKGFCMLQATGESWRWLESSHEQSQWANSKPSDQDVWFLDHTKVQMVGLGQAPNFLTHVREWSVIDATGNLAVDRFEVLDCEQPGQ